MTLTHHPLFSAPFRPLFLLAALAATFLPMFYVCFLVNDYRFFGVFYDINDWHIHEMLFGFVPVLISGFILTAGSHWSGNEMIKGGPLILLASLWVIERVVLFFDLISPFLTLIIIQFYLIYFYYLLHLTLKGNKKNYLPFMIFFLSLMVAKFLFSYGVYQSKADLSLFGQQFAISLYLLIIIWISGRVIPFFIEKKISDISIKIPLLLHYSAYISILLLIPLQLFEVRSLYISSLAMIAFLLHMSKFFLFRPFITMKEPMIRVLLIAYFFICLHLLGLALTPFYNNLANGNGVLHLFTAGGIGIMGIGFMVRVSLGHTGRKMKATKVIQFIFILTMVGALIRSLLPMFFLEYHYDSLHFSMGLWTMGFLLFLIVFTPILFTARK